MRVRVDEAGGENRVGTVETLPGLEAAVNLGFRANGGDALATNGHGAVFDHTALRVHRYDVARAPHRIGGLGVESGKTQQDETKETRHRMVSGTGWRDATFPWRRAD